MKEALLKVCRDIFGKERLQVAVQQLIQLPSAMAQRAASGAAPGTSSGGPCAAPRSTLPALPPAAVAPLGGLPTLHALGALAPVPVRPDPSRKRPLPAQGASQPQGPAGASGAGPDAAKRARVEGPAALADGYSIAAAAADEATGADRPGDADGAEGPGAFSKGFDIFQVAGVDMSQEEEALGASGFTAAGAAEAPVAEEPWADRIATASMRDRLRGVCQQCGVEGADEGATRLLAEGLGERLSGLLGTLRHLANHRTGAHKEMFGIGAFRVSLDPKVPWRKRVADEARAAVQPVPPVQPRPRAPRPAQPSLADDERRMSQMAGLGAAAGGAGGGLGEAAGGAGGGQKVSVTAADVLWQLEQEPQSGRSRVVQWWRCEGRPLRRYARRSARLYIAQVRSGRVAGRPLAVGCGTAKQHYPLGPDCCRARLTPSHACDAPPHIPVTPPRPRDPPRPR